MAIGLRAAKQRPTRFTGLVLANTWTWPPNGDRPAELASRFRGGPLRNPAAREMAHYRQALGAPGRRGASALLPPRITAGRAGHFVRSEAADEFAAAIRNWRRQAQRES
ncbi:MAG TPA: hypothetical protein VGN81_00460 [Pseudonocardiaceae bacterium]